MARRLERVAHDRVPAAAPLRRQLAAEGERHRGIYPHKNASGEPSALGKAAKTFSVQFTRLTELRTFWLHCPSTPFDRE